MTARPEWMLEEDELIRAVYAYTGGGDSSKLERSHRNLWLRAQIAVLEEMREKLTPEMTGAADAIIFAKLTALQKELGG